MFQFDIVKCRERLNPWIIKTPVVESETLSEITGKRVYLKLETLQKTGAFKFRGAMNYLLTLTPDLRKKGVITASSGNHGLGMSLGSKLLGVKCTVVMPLRAPLTKQERAKKYGAKVVLYGDSYDEAAAYAKHLAEREDSAYVPSFNNPSIMEGQGTILAEIASELPDVDTVIVPIGGGGLIAGLLLAKEDLGLNCNIIGAEPEGAASMKASLEAGKLVTLDSLETIADGVAVKTVGDLTFKVVSQKRPDIVIVSDEEIKRAQKLMLTQAKVLSEPAGAVSVAALLSPNLSPENPEKVVCVITGANLDEEGLRELLSV